MPITQTYRILCNNRESLKRHQVIMTHISKEEEHIIDKIVNAHILLIRGDKQFKITKKQIYCYGEVDFNSEEDLDQIDKFDFLNYLGSRGLAVPSDYDFETHSCYPETKGVKWTETWTPSIITKYAYACLNKPKRIVLFVNPIK